MTKQTRKSRKHLPSVEHAMFNFKTGAIMVVVNDIGHRRITTKVGMDVDAMRVAKIQIFPDRDSLRETLEAQLNHAEANGFVAV